MKTYTISLAIVMSAVGFPALSASWWSAVRITPVLVDADFQAASAVIAVDLDADGLTDIAGAGKYEDRITWWRNLGSDQWVRYDIFLLNGASAICAHDIDEDGDIDLIGCSKAEDSVWWFENKLEAAHGGTPTFEPHFIMHFNCEPMSVDAGDFDDDGDLDIAIAFEHYPQIIIALNLTGVGFGYASLQLPVFGNGVSYVRTDDFDQDGDMDIIADTPWDWVGHPKHGHVNYYWFRNEGNAQFSEQLPIGGGLDLHAANAADIADMNGDGLKDLVVMSGDVFNTNVTWFRRLDKTGEAWDGGTYIDTQFAGADGDQSLHLADLNNDRRIDIVAGSYFGDQRITVWLNLGAGQFQRHELEEGFAAHGVTTADLDNDGTLEVIGGSWEYYAGQVKYWRLSSATNHLIANEE